jgi:hypothetical protein
MLAEEEYVENTQPTAEPEYQEPEIEIIDDEPESEEVEEADGKLTEDEASLLQEDEGGLEEAPDPLELANKKIAELRKKLDKTNRHYGQTRQQAADLQKELEQARVFAEKQAQIARNSVEHDVDKQILMATKKLKEAKENGDIDAETAATIELQRANYTKSKMEDYRYQQQLNEDAAAATAQAQQAIEESQEPYDPYYFNKENFQGWMDQNDYWLNPQSPQHNPVLFDGVDRFITQWNADIVEQGWESWIGSDEYNQILQQKVDEARTKLNTQRRRQPQMKPVQRAGAPVRGPSRGAPTGSQPIKLERREHEMLQGLRNHGFKVKTETYLAKKEALANKRGPWG